MDIVLKQQENKSYKRRMAVAVCTTLLIVIVLGFTISIPTVRADIDWEEFSEEFALLNPENAASCFAPTISKLMTGMFIKNMTDYFYSQDVSDTFLNIIVPGSAEGRALGATEDGKTFIDILIAALKGVAMFICFFYSLDNVLKEVNKGELTEESWLRIFLYFMIPAILILNYSDIFEAFKSVGFWIRDIMSDATGEANIETFTDMEIEGKPWPGLLDIGLVQWIFNSFLTGLIQILFYFIANMAVVITILAGIVNNYVEVVLRAIFMPLAIANVNHEGMRSAGFRYIKKFFGCFLKLGGIYIAVQVVFYIYNTLVNLPGTADIHRTVFLILLLPATKTAIKMLTHVIEEGLGTTPG